MNFKKLLPCWNKDKAAQAEQEPATEPEIKQSEENAPTLKNSKISNSQSNASSVDDEPDEGRYLLAWPYSPRTLAALLIFDANGFKTDHFSNQFIFVFFK